MTYPEQTIPQGLLQHWYAALTGLILLCCLLAVPMAEAKQSLVPVVPQGRQTAAKTTGQATVPPAEDILDIKPPVQIDQSPAPWLIYAGIALIVLLGTGLVLYKRKRTTMPPAPAAHTWALAQLDKARQLFADDEYNQFVNLIDHTLRTYIEQRFGVTARRQTSREFITRLSSDQASVPLELANNIDNLQVWLSQCDRVKFARARLTKNDMESMLKNINDFIQATREPQP